VLRFLGKLLALAFVAALSAFALLWIGVENIEVFLRTRTPEKFWVLLANSEIFHAIHEIGKNRRIRSWLPDWFFSNGGLINIDGYHMTKGISRYSFFLAGFYFPWDPITLLHWAWNGSWVWFVSGNIMDLCYHTIFMKRQYIEIGIWIWLKELKQLLFGGKE